MGLIDIASSRSVWRGLEYFNQKKVRSCEDNGDGTYEGIVEGSEGRDYRVHLDMTHPRKSTCDCPLASDKMVICKHIVAVSFCVDPSEADRFRNEKTVFKSEEEERKAKRYVKYLRAAKSMSLKELREAFAEAMVELDEYRFKEMYGGNNKIVK